jgi:hypothetical protein
VSLAPPVNRRRLAGRPERGACAPGRAARHVVVAVSIAPPRRQTATALPRASNTTDGVLAPGADSACAGAKPPAARTPSIVPPSVAQTAATRA